MNEYDTVTIVHVIPETIITPGAKVLTWHRVGFGMKCIISGVAAVTTPQKMPVKVFATGDVTMVVTVTEA